MRRRGLLILILPIVAIGGLFLAADSLREPEPPPVRVKRVVRMVDGVEVVETVPVRQVAPAPSRRWFGPEERPARVPAAADIDEAAELARIQSTYQNYRTAALTENHDLRKSLLAVLKRDGQTAVEYARQDVDLAETEADRAFAKKLVAELTR